ncbi:MULTISPECIES: PTS system mannose/fructose/sorbose family transporter subunit IID [Enterococcus]|uniref:PTS system mannose-specific IID component n=1 Tax=Enterococcus malodoratus ATCC 43197 TaxID=1158601 RepID=R2NR06_9ENTE|nr:MULTISPECIES: PTS system mannose/fructose/sorbose family transporter subunit IID [Enterococcus]EOH74442.1 PTS system mannose-specific IID component [Enterococcus malodoratus ATCC 43197]EOT67172.1 hypothetical protein I585_02693 [Enterococcus malodoratus ATCC 43197]SET78958.1 PTS system, mannose-specific IID component [Enterococcus malodoratus]SPW90950.1 PTS system, mannose/fructose/sorbose-specific IID component [Enterococcus malodoratus]STD69576.1 PTS system, mannose/fructose/sorbose-speci
MSKIGNDLTKEEKKLVRQMFWRSQTLYVSVNPAKQGANGFCYSMMPFINAFYKEEDQRKEALVRHMSYFNTTVPMVSFIMGIAASMEKENSEKANFDVASINAVKTSLMGPLAGIGDSIFWGVWRVISAGIAVGLATSGNVLAPLVFLALFNIPQWLTRYYGAFLGYSLGSKYIERLYSEGLIGILTKGASMVGLMMVGAMTSSMVVFQTKLSFAMQGETVMKLQEMLDQIFVGIVPLLLTLLCYYLLKKKFSITVLMLGIIVLGIILSALGIA